MSSFPKADDHALPEAQQSLNQSYDNCQYDNQQQTPKLLQNKRRQQHRLSISKRQKNQNLVAPQVDKKFPRDFFNQHGGSAKLTRVAANKPVDVDVDESQLDFSAAAADLKNILINQQKVLAQHNQTYRKKKLQPNLQDCYSQSYRINIDNKATQCTPPPPLPNQLNHQRSLAISTRRAYDDQLQARNQSKNIRGGGLCGNKSSFNNNELLENLRQQPMMIPLEEVQVADSINNTPNNKRKNNIIYSNQQQSRRHDICNSIDKMLTEFNTYTALSPQQKQHRNQLMMMQTPNLRNGVSTSINERRPPVVHYPCLNQQANPASVNSKFSLPRLQPQQHNPTKYINYTETNNSDLLSSQNHQTRKPKYAMKNNSHIIDQKHLNFRSMNRRPSNSKSFVLEQFVMNSDPLTIMQPQNQLDPQLDESDYERIQSSPQSPVALARQELQRENDFIKKLQVVANNASTHRVFTTSKKQEVVPRLTKKNLPPQRLPSLSAHTAPGNQQEISSSVKKNLLKVIDQDPYANLQVKPFSAATADQNGSSSKKRLNNNDKINDNVSISPPPEDLQSKALSPPSTTFGNGLGFFDESTQISTSVQNNQFDISSGSYNNALKAFTSDLDPTLNQKTNKKKQFKNKAHFEDLLVSTSSNNEGAYNEDDRNENIGTPTFKRRESVFEDAQEAMLKKNRFSNYRTQTTGKLSAADESIQDEDLFQTSAEDSTFNQIGDGL